MGGVGVRGCARAHNSAVSEVQADGVNDAGGTGADAAEDEREVRLAAAVTDPLPYDTQRHIVRTQFPAEGTLWGEAAKGISCGANAQYVLCDRRGKQGRVPRRAGTSIVALGRSFMPSAERSAYDFSAGADPLCLHQLDTRNAGERQRDSSRLSPPASGCGTECSEAASQRSGSLAAAQRSEVQRTETDGVRL